MREKDKHEEKQNEPKNNDKLKLILYGLGKEYIFV